MFYGEGNKDNRAIWVGGAQTNQRAELTAVLHCLQHEPNGMHIYTDSKYVQQGIELSCNKW